MKEKFEYLEEQHRKAEMGGGEERIKKQHDKNKLTARERIHFLLDEGSFEELDKFVLHRERHFGMGKKKVLSDGVITGYGRINGRLVYVYSQDFTVFGGSLSEMHAKKICKVMDLAMQNGAPVIGLNDSGGARIQEGVDSLGGYADIFYRNTRASGVVPQISAIMGPCAGGAVYSPAITDFIMMVENTSYMYVTGPNVVKTVTHEEVTHEELGGAKAHGTKSGVTQFTYQNEMTCIQGIKNLLSYIPQNCEEFAPMQDYEEEPESEVRESLNKIVPNDPNQPYDMHEVIGNVVDDNSFMEVHEDYAENIIVGFARIAGRSIGVVANQPMTLAGVLISKLQGKELALSAFATRLISRCWFLWMCPALCPVPIRSGTVLFPMEPSYCMRSVKLPCPALLSLLVKHTGGLMT
jgi:propionyl-CoA carboxylase beta chain